MEYDIQRAKQALEFLTETPYFSHYTKRLKALMGRPRALPYKEEAEPLNELLIIGRQSPQALDNLLDAVQFKRGDRNSYQREYMAAKRSRERKVAQLESLLRGRELKLDERRDLLLKQYDIWNREKDAFLAARSTEHRAQFNEDPDWQARNAYTKRFWEIKDDELDALLQEATRTLAQTTVKRKRLVVVEQPKATVMREKLLEVLDKRKR
jgi:hypothetical protein